MIGQPIASLQELASLAPGSLIRDVHGRSGEIVKAVHGTAIIYAVLHGDHFTAINELVFELNGPFTLLHQEPRTITTMDEASGLPAGAVIVDNKGYAWQMNTARELNLAGSNYVEFEEKYLPAVVIQEGRP